MTNRNGTNQRADRQAALRAFEESLAQAVDTSDVTQALTQVILDTIGASGIVFYPLYRGAVPDSDVVLHSALIDKETAARLALSAFTTAEQELRFVDDYLRGTERTRDIMQHYGRENMTRSRIYEEFLVPCKIDHAIAAFLGSERATAVGYLLLTRSKKESPFTVQDVDQVEIIRQAAEQTLCRILDKQGDSSTSSQILGVLTAGMPQASALLDGNGALVWANRAAEQKLGEQVWHVSGHFLMFSSSPVVDRWRDAVRETVSLRESPFRVDPHLTVSRIDRPNKSPLYLVVDTDVSAETESEWKSLSAREREIAKLAAQGFAPINIGVLLSISPGTVRNHLKSIYKKLRITSRVELALKMIP